MSLTTEELRASVAGRKVVALLGNGSTPPQDSGCVEWTGTRSAAGYGQVCVSYMSTSPHRLSYCMAHNLGLGDIHGLVVMHTCDNPPCLNPWHLRLGSQRQNMADCRAKGRNVRGESHPSAKLSNEDVEFIRRNHRPGVNPADRGNTLVLAQTFGVAQGTISAITRGSAWC